MRFRSVIQFVKRAIAPRHNRLLPEANTVVGFDGNRLWCRHPDRPPESMDWEYLSEVTIETNSMGPWLCDVFWVLRAGERTIVIPQGATGEADLQVRLQQLPGFDNEELIQAMRCTREKVFCCWRRKSGRKANSP